jgi:hypothetical protein
MKRTFSSVGLFLLIGLTGCSQSAIIDKVAPDAVAAAKTYFDQLRSHQYAQIQNVLNKSIKDPDLQATLARAAKHIPDGDPISEKTVGAYVRCNTHTCETTITLEYEFPSQWLLFKAVSQSEDGYYSLTGVWVQPLTQSLEESNRFTLRGKSFFQYIILLLAVLLPAFTIYTMVLCIRTKGLRRKWLWIVFILCGFSDLTMVWTTGQYSFQLLNIKILSAGAYAQPYSSWVISISAPIGAIFFLLYQGFPRDTQTPSLPASELPPVALNEVEKGEVAS